MDQPWPVIIIERSSRLAFSYRPWPAQNTKSISDMVYPHCPCHAHFSTDVFHGLPTSLLSYAHHLSIVGRLRPASSLDWKKKVRQHQLLPAYVDFVLHKFSPLSGIPWLHHLWQAQRSADLQYGLPSSPFSCTQW